jgi:hypothetical protein
VAASSCGCGRGRRRLKVVSALAALGGLGLTAVAAPAMGFSGPAAGTTTSCNPLTGRPAVPLISARATNLRPSPAGLAAGESEPNVEAAYGEALAWEPAGETGGLSGRARANGTIRVPVAFHIVQPNDATAVVSDETVAAQIDEMNAGFSGALGGDDTGVRFHLVDTDRTVNAAWQNLDYDDPASKQMRLALHQGGTRTLNLYAAVLDPNLLGWGTLPSQNAGQLDGVVIDFRVLPGGAYTPFDEGDIANHEAGHWVGLFHTFEGSCSPNGDLVDDTTPEDSPAIGCPVGRDSCFGGDEDPIHNFMDYSDDSCVFEFTAGQGDRMHQEIGLYRNSAPEGVARSVQTPAGKPIVVQATATDPDGDALTYAVTTPPSNGSLSGPAGSPTYTPDPGHAGADSFTVRATDIFGLTDESVITVTTAEAPPLGLGLDFRHKQALGRLSIRGTCGAQSCELAAATEITARARGRSKRRIFDVKPATATAAAGDSGKLRLRMAKPAQRKLKRLLGKGWKATAESNVTATDGFGRQAGIDVSFDVTR